MEVSTAETVALIHRGRARGARIILNLAPALPIETAALSALDLLVVNETEPAWLGDHLGCGTDAAALRATVGVDLVRTLGEDGADVATASVAQRVPAHRITPVDTTTAGDCFVGALAAALDRGASLAEALTRASVAAAVCCTRAGSQSGLPTTAEFDAPRGTRGP
jgi:ribokinase